MKDTINRAFPVPDDASDMPGMTLRDYFAAKVLQGFCAADEFTWDDNQRLANRCYDIADSMMKARTK